MGMQGLRSGVAFFSELFLLFHTRELLWYERLPPVLKSSGNTVSDTFNYQTRCEQNSFKSAGGVWSLKGGLRRLPRLWGDFWGLKLWLSCASLGSDLLGCGSECPPRKALPSLPGDGGWEPQWLSSGELGSSTTGREPICSLQT